MATKATGKKGAKKVTEAPPKPTQRKPTEVPQKSQEKAPSASPTKRTPKKERGDYTFPEDVEVDLAVWLHQRPHLWDTTDEGYRDLDLIRQTWDEGADQFNCTGEYLN